MRRRLDVVASLIVTPLVLFLDEPTTGLDPRSRADIWATVGTLAAEGTTVLLTTQYLDEADRLSRPDRDHRLGAGDRARQPGRAQGRDRQPGRRRGGRRRRPGRGAPAVAARLAQRPPSLEPSERRLTAAIAAGAVTLPELVRELDAAGVAAEDVSIRRPTLDEVFLDSTAASDQN